MPLVEKTGNEANSAAQIEHYLAHAKAHQRRLLTRAALAMVAVGLTSWLAIAFMSDIGHATGFFALGGACMAGAGITYRSARRL